jgi:NAD(P)-dependent dehydrogenase (short-subunit alcohol dehydrogenase family)
MTWDPRSLPSQAGRTIVVTGGSTGIGYWACEQLAATGARDDRDPAAEGGKVARIPAARHCC